MSLMVCCEWCQGSGYRDDLSSALCRHCGGTGLLPIDDEIPDWDDEEGAA